MKSCVKRDTSSLGGVVCGVDKKTKTENARQSDFFHFIAPLPTEAFLRKLPPQSLLCLQKTSTAGFRLVKREVETRIRFYFKSGITVFTFLKPEKLNAYFEKVRPYDLLFSPEEKGMESQHTTASGWGGGGWSVESLCCEMMCIFGERVRGGETWSVTTYFKIYIH
jgi:hypothetical protein